MRVVKFRYRFENPTYGIRTEIFTLEEIEAGCVPNEWECLSRDEYTGKKDRKDKCIYEGDVVIFQEDVEKYNRLAEELHLPLSKIIDSVPSKGIVEWQPPGFFIKPIKIGHKKYGDGQQFEYDFYCPDGEMFGWEQLEVIGRKDQNEG